MKNRCRLLLRNCVGVFVVVALTTFFAGCDVDGGSMDWPSFTVVYHPNGGVGYMEDSVHRHGSTQDLSANSFVREGHSFAGWARSPNGTVEFTDRQSVSNLITADGVVVTLYAIWRAHTFTIIFNANSGHGNMAPSILTYGDSLALNSFTHESETFLGWALSSDGHVEFRDGENVRNLNIADGGEIMLFARWGSGIFTLTFNVNGGSGLAPVPQMIAAGDSMILPSGVGLSKAEHTFGGWNTRNDGMGFSIGAGATYTPYRNVTMYAKWNPDSFTVVFNINGGSGTVPIPRRVTPGSSITIPDGGGFSKGGHTFGGWNTRNDGTGTSLGAGVTYTPTRSLTLYAIWSFNGIIVPIDTLAAQFLWLQSYAQSGGHYLIEVVADESIAPQVLSFYRRGNITIILRSFGEQRTIGLSVDGGIFTVDFGVTLVLDGNITLQGRARNTHSLVRINSGGTLVMNTGARIIGNNSPAGPNGNGAGVRVEGTLIMNDGEISGNTVRPAGGFVVGGGGVSVGGEGRFDMHDGTISGNTANSQGGGVSIARGGTFRMGGGVIYGRDASPWLRNTAAWGAALIHDGRVQRGIFSNGTFTSTGNLPRTNNYTIRVADGVLQ